MSFTDGRTGSKFVYRRRNAGRFRISPSARIALDAGSVPGGGNSVRLLHGDVPDPGSEEGGLSSGNPDEAGDELRTKYYTEKLPGPYGHLGEKSPEMTIALRAEAAMMRVLAELFEMLGALWGAIGTLVAGGGFFLDNAGVIGAGVFIGMGGATFVLAAVSLNAYADVLEGMANDPPEWDFRRVVEVLPTQQNSQTLAAVTDFERAIEDVETALRETSNVTSGENRKQDNGLARDAISIWTCTRSLLMAAEFMGRYGVAYTDAYDRMTAATASGDEAWALQHALMRNHMHRLVIDELEVCALQISAIAGVLRSSHFDLTIDEIRQADNSGLTGDPSNLRGGTVTGGRFRDNPRLSEAFATIGEDLLESAGYAKDFLHA